MKEFPIGYAREVVVAGHQLGRGEVVRLVPDAVLAGSARGHTEHRITTGRPEGCPLEVHKTDEPSVAVRIIGPRGPISYEGTVVDVTSSRVVIDVSDYIGADEVYRS